MTLPLQRSRETVELDVDLDFEPQCDYGRDSTPAADAVSRWWFDPCEQTAKWAAERACCHLVALRCDAHLLRQFRGFSGVCALCAIAMPIESCWSRIEPLR